MVDETLVSVSETALERLLHGDRDAVRAAVSADVPQSTPIGEVELNEEYTLTGVVRSISDVNTFQRSDGSDGQVRNIRIQDRTGDIRVALWGDKADFEMSVGDYVHLHNAEVDTGYEEQTEASVGYNSTLKVIPHENIDPGERYVTITMEDTE
jgi:replication factor A1